MNAIGADENIGPHDRDAAADPVANQQLHRVVAMPKGFDAVAEANTRRVKSLFHDFEQRQLETSTMHRKLRRAITRGSASRLAPNELTEAVVVAQIRNTQTDWHQVTQDAEIGEFRRGVRQYVDSDAERPRLRHSLKELHVDAAIMKHQCGRQPADTAACDRYPHVFLDGQSAAELMRPLALTMAEEYSALRTQSTPSRDKAYLMTDVVRDDAPAGSMDDDYYRRLTEAHVEPLWRLRVRLLTPAPTPAALPWIWRGAQLRGLCAEARELVSMDAGGDRRVLTLANPGLGGLPFATPTLSAAYQTLAAREAAPAHRHTPAALRFILHGRGVTTIVDGDVIDMAAGDLILTPSWAYHDHTNDTDDTMTWFDGLDVPLVRALDAVFFQNHPEERQPVSTVGHSEERFGYAGLSPTDVPGRSRYSPLLVYRWANTDAALESILRSNGSGVASVAFTDPVSGGPALPTIGCRMLRLRSGATTTPSRQTGSRVMVVYRGSGESRVGDSTFTWEPGDVIAVPSWSVLHHRAHTDADVFFMSDEPVLRALHLFREETLPNEAA